MNKKLLLSLCAIISGSAHGMTPQQAVDFYIYAYPLVTMAVTQQAMTNNGRINNQFVHITEFPTHTFKDIVRPNVDTLYSFAWLDLHNGPITLSVPDTKGRYYLLELMDAWTNVFSSLGKRTTGTKAQSFVIVGPDFHGKLPKNMKHLKKIKAPTNMVFILARTQTNGKADYAFVHEIQRGYKINGMAGISMPQAIGKRTAPVDVVNSMNAQQFYTLFSETSKTHPLSADALPVLQAAIPVALKKIADKKNSFKLVNGWSVMLNIGKYGTDYLLRAMIAEIGIGANLPEDAVYPTAFVDSSGVPLTGKNSYVIHFDKNQLPPVNAFWSVTLYNAQSFLSKNSLGRYALGDRDTLQLNADGSLDMYIQRVSPGKDKESNWLPAPAGEFNITMRLYWPKPSILKGVWTPPGIVRI